MVTRWQREKLRRLQRMALNEKQEHVEEELMMDDAALAVAWHHRQNIEASDRLLERLQKFHGSDKLLDKPPDEQEE